jgi:hypothetical protein
LAAPSASKRPQTATPPQVGWEAGDAWVVSYGEGEGPGDAGTQAAGMRLVRRGLESLSVHIAIQTFLRATHERRLHLRAQDPMTLLQGREYAVWADAAARALPHLHAPAAPAAAGHVPSSERPARSSSLCAP